MREEGREGGRMGEPSGETRTVPSLSRSLERAHSLGGAFAPANARRTANYPPAEHAHCRPKTRRVAYEDGMGKTGGERDRRDAGHRTGITNAGASAKGEGSRDEIFCFYFIFFFFLGHEGEEGRRHDLRT